MELADLALTNAITIEVTKSGLTQRTKGDYVLRFAVAATEMDQRLLQAAVGARFACVLVAVDDEQQPPAEKQKWADLGAVKQSAMRCKEQLFRIFLSEEMFGGAVLVSTEESAAQIVREHCGVASRSDMSKPGESAARDLWYRLDARFQAWKVQENA